MNVLIVDLECACFDKPKRVGEIIEIGLYHLNKKISILVKPDYDTISPYCTNLTGITQEMVDNIGISLNDAFDQLKPYNKLIWASYGEFDKKKLVEECYNKAVDWPLSNRHINVKTLFSLKYNRKGCGMKKALNILQLPLIGQHHRGSDDAENIYRILERIIA